MPEEKIEYADPRIENLDTSRIANIMSVALEEFSQADYQSSSFNRIIKNSGISKGTMYYYFKSKEDVFLTFIWIRTEFKSFSLFHFLMRSQAKRTTGREFRKY